jgi:hypothetical protein
MNTNKLHVNELHTSDPQSPAVNPFVPEPGMYSQYGELEQIIRVALVKAQGQSIDIALTERITEKLVKALSPQPAPEELEAQCRQLATQIFNRFVTAGGGARLDISGASKFLAAFIRQREAAKDRIIHQQNEERIAIIAENKRNYEELLEQQERTPLREALDDLAANWEIDDTPSNFVCAEELRAVIAKHFPGV